MMSLGTFFHKNGGKFPQKIDGFHPKKISCNFLKIWNFKQIISNFFEFSKNNLITAKLEKAPLIFSFLPLDGGLLIQDTALVGDAQVEYKTILVLFSFI